MFYKKSKQKVTGKWYPVSVVRGKQITTDQVADQLAKISTVSRADVYAVLKELGGVMGQFMAQGKSVKLDGIGSFRFTASAHKNGVDTPEEVNATLINRVRVRFIEETFRPNAGITSRSIANQTIDWVCLDGSDGTGDGNSSSDSGSDDDELM